MKKIKKQIKFKLQWQCIQKTCFEWESMAQKNALGTQIDLFCLYSILKTLKKKSKNPEIPKFTPKYTTLPNFMPFASTQQQSRPQRKSPDAQNNVWGPRRVKRSLCRI